MIDDIQAAAMRRTKWRAAPRADDSPYSWCEADHEWSELRYMDADTLANAYIADLAAREAAERERALPISDDWLRSIGFEDRYQGALGIGCLDRMSSGRWEFMQDGNLPYSAWPTNRGEVLGLLRGLKIPTKTTEVTP